jgi:AsmA-like C-terminal region
MRPPPTGYWRMHVKKIIVFGFMALLAIGIAVWLRYSPFARGPVLQDLSEASDSAVTVRGFRQVHFPFPGCVIDGLVFHHGDVRTPPLITIKRLTIRGSYFGMLAGHVASINAEGMRVTVAPFGSNEALRTQPSKIVIDEIEANGSQVEFLSRDPQKPALRFDIHEVSLRNVGWSGPLKYKFALHNPEPPGEIAAQGEFGVWNQTSPDETPVSGEYTFDRADLGVYEGIAGTLASKGKFSGTLKHIDISGHIDIPDFEVRSTGHEVHLTADYTAYVDARHGDTYLQRVDAQFRKTRVLAEGSVAGMQGRKGKTALIQLTATQARIEDILGLISHEPHAPMAGLASLKAKVEIPPGEEPFLKKVKLDGNFGIDDGTFTKTETQNDVNHLSAGARGDNKDDATEVVSDLKGRAQIADGTATFSNLTFGIPGALASMHGTYSIITHKVDMHGTMQVDSNISKTTTGVKSLMLKIIDPIFKKKKRGEIVPVHIAGTYEHPQFGLDLEDRGDHSQAAKASEQKH